MIAKGGKEYVTTDLKVRCVLFSRYPYWPSASKPASDGVGQDLMFLVDLTDKTALYSEPAVSHTMVRGRYARGRQWH